MEETILEKITEKYRNNYQKAANKRKPERQKHTPKPEPTTKQALKFILTKTPKRKINKNSASLSNEQKQPHN